MSQIFRELLQRRGVTEDFLCPKYEKGCNAKLLPDLDLATERLKNACEKQEKVLIYGDYDVDGVTASTAMYDILRLIGIEQIEIMLPNRFVDGYGMSEKILEKAAAEKINLVITVDCGSRNHVIIEKLKQNGIDTIITDHHECAETLPNAVAVVNPKRKDLEIPIELKGLAGVGVVFKLAEGLVEAGMIPEGQEKWLLDLVLIGTICDSMPMGMENRRLCYYGLKVINKTRRPGLKELLRLIKARKISGDTIGFQIGPRLNAAGRLESAEIALELLMATNRPKAAQLALKLDRLNKERREKQDAAFSEIRQNGIGEEPVIIVEGDWHEGVLGIIAGHLTETYHQPAFALAPSGSNLKGSGRSFGEFNLAAALETCSDLLLSGGGHAEACGVTIKAKDFEAFKLQVNNYYRSLKLQNQERFLELSADLEISDYHKLSLELAEEIGQLEPFSANNTQPIFRLRDARIVEVSYLGENREHLRLTVWDNNGERLKLMWFYAPEKYLKMKPGGTADIWITLEENEFRGLRSVEGRILRIAS